MIDYENDCIYRNFSMRYPDIAKDVVEIHYGDFLDLNMELKDGTRLAFDHCEETLRYLPKDESSMTEEEYRKEFGIRLSRRMRRKGMMQSELSELTGITQANISNYINGRTAPGLYTLDKIARALDCSLEDLRYKF